MNNQIKELIIEPSPTLDKKDMSSIINWRKKQRMDMSDVLGGATDKDDRILNWQLRIDALKTMTSLDIKLRINDKVILGVDGNKKEVVDLSRYFNDVLGVSRSHLKIIATSTELLVMDTNSTNGTRLNGRMINHDQPYKINDGDFLELGNLMVVMNILESPKEQNLNFENKRELVIRAINHLLTLVNSKMKLDDVLNRILDISLKITGTDEMAVLLPDRNASTFSLKVHRGMGDKSVINFSLYENDFLKEVTRNGISVKIKGKKGRRSKVLGGDISGDVLYTPLALGEDKLGVLISVQNANSDGFKIEDEFIVQMIGKLIVAALHASENNITLNMTVQRKLDDSSTYKKTLQALLSQNDLIGIYNELRELIRGRWDVENVGLWLVDDVTRRLEPFPKPSFHRAYVFGDGLIGVVASQAEPKLAYDIEIFSDVKNSQEPTLQLLARSAVCVPLFDNDSVFGILAMFSIKENGFNEDDVATLTMYSQAVSEVIAKTLLFEQIETQKATIFAAVNMLHHPLIIINQDGKLVMSNNAAATMIDELQSAWSNKGEQSGGITSPSLLSFLNELSSSKSKTKEIVVGDKVYVATLESAAMIGTIILLQDVTDPVTGMFSHHHYHVLSEQVFMQAKRYKKSLAVLVVGYENFNKVLEVQGYAIGNKMLKDLAIRLRSCLRKPDILGRYQDEGFVVILPETGLISAKATAERILHQLQENSISVEKSKPLVGIALLNIDKDSSLDELVENAGQAFLLGNTKKGNNIVVYE